MDNFDGNLHSAAFKKCESKIQYALGRVNNVTVGIDDKDSLEKNNKLLVEIITLSSVLDSKSKTFKKSSTRIFLNVPVANVESDEDVSDSDTSESEESNLSSIHVSARRSNNHLGNSFTVPAYKWNIKYSGEPNQSLNAFLQDVEEMRIARNVSHQQLFFSALDLFTGKAKYWYRVMRKSISSWQTLVEALKEEFQPPNYDEKLFEEIKRRTQGPKESVGVYFAIMQNLFACMSVNLPEATQLKIISRNLAPYIQGQLGIQEYSSISELRRTCKIIEDRRIQINSYVPPPTRMMGSDLAYLHIDETKGRVNAIQQERDINRIKCFNCHEMGHIAKFCQRQKEYRQRKNIVSNVIRKDIRFIPVRIVNVRETGILDRRVSVTFQGDIKPDA